MSRAAISKAAVEAADKPGSGLKVEPDLLGPGLRDWFGSLGRYRVKAAVLKSCTTSRTRFSLAHASRNRGRGEPLFSDVSHHFSDLG
jgi:hypothetical protein